MDTDSESLSESDFDEDDIEELNQRRKKTQTPRPSLHEISDILKHLDFNDIDLTFNLDEQSSPQNDVIPLQSSANKARSSFSNLQEALVDTESKTQDATDEVLASSPFEPRPDVRETTKVKAQRRGNRYYINQYLCYKVLGAGSFGKVMLGKDITSHHKVAIKIINKSLLRRKKILRKGSKPGNMLENIFREIAIMKKLDHPNIVRLYEVIDDPSNDKLYMVLEYMKNGSVLPDGGKAKCDPITDMGAIWKYFRDMVLGIDFLHRNNVIHADIKPENLLIGDDLSLRVADFGVSYFLENTQGIVSKALGTPAFIAPECENRDFRAYPLDIWAMGVTLYMMITGICPFAGPSIHETFDKIQSEEPEIPSKLDPNLQDLLKRLLLKDPSKRITIGEIKKHPWVTEKGKTPLVHPPSAATQVAVSEHDVDEAVTLPNQMVTTYRRASQTDIFSDAKAAVAASALSDNSTAESDNRSHSNSNGSDTNIVMSKAKKQSKNGKKATKSAPSKPLPAAPQKKVNKSTPAATAAEKKQVGSSSSSRGRGRGKRGRGNRLFGPVGKARGRGTKGRGRGKK